MQRVVFSAVAVQQSAGERLAGGSGQRLDQRRRFLEGEAVHLPQLERPHREAVRTVELHWYEAHGVGRVKIKIKRFLD